MSLKGTESSPVTERLKTAIRNQNRDNPHQVWFLVVKTRARFGFGQIPLPSFMSQKVALKRHSTLLWRTEPRGAPAVWW